MPHLRLLVFTGPRNRGVDYNALRARGVAVCSTEGGPALESTCEQAWSLILALTRRTEWALRIGRGGPWRPDRPFPLPTVLHGERLGLVGCGNIGARVAAVARAFGMEVVTWSPNMTEERAAAHGASAVTLEELLRTSRVVSLHLVPTPATRHVIDAQRLSLMRRDAVLVNTARAELLDTDALVQALQEGRIAGAGLDVFLNEPLPADHPLRVMPQVALTPHLGFVNELSFAAFALGISQALQAWLSGSPLPRLVDLPGPG
jgi:phosphoglycerate dehydrogenase-like enzyme